MRPIAAAAVLVAASAANAQTHEYAIRVLIDRPVLEPGEFAHVVLAPAFNTVHDYAMAGWAADIQGRAFASHISNISAIAPWSSQTSGAPCDAGWCGLAVGQLHFPAAGIFANPTSPLPAYGMTFTAPAVTEPTEVAFHTTTTRFMVYPDRASPDAESRLDQLVEARATILVVPCRADFDGDDRLTFFDFLAFQNAFFRGEPLADFDFDGDLTIFDFLAFQSRFVRGC